MAAGYQVSISGKSQATTGADENVFGAACDVSDCKNLTAFVTVGLCTANITRLDAWLQGTLDGVNWFDLTHDGARIHSGAAADAAASPGAGYRNIIDIKTTVAAATWSAQYKNIAVKQVRGAAIFNVDATGIVSNFGLSVFGTV